MVYSVIAAFGAVIAVAAAIFVTKPSDTSAHQPPPSYGAAPEQPAPTDGTVQSKESNSGPTAQVPPDLRDSFERAIANLDGEVGIAMAPVGDPSKSPMLLGNWAVGAAWSTIKVPLTIAALRERSAPELTDDMRAAITLSSNSAAEALWQGLGPPTTAAQKVESVLREAGDSTVVQAEKVRPQFSAFGQTQWSLTDQTRFLSYLACSGADSPVLELMGQISPDQAWGLGEVEGSRYKGGWGPSPVEKYLVRQMGLFPTTDGIVAVAIAAEPASGSFADGVDAVNVVAEWLKSLNSRMLPLGNCPS